MPINGMSLLNDPTVAITGGTPVVFEDDGTQIANGIQVSDTTATDPRLAMKFVGRNKNTVRQSDGSFSKLRKNGSFSIPFILADGSISYQIFRYECELHPEYIGAGNLPVYRKYAAQTVVDTELDKFFEFGSVK